MFFLKNLLCASMLLNLVTGLNAQQREFPSFKVTGNNNLEFNNKPATDNAVDIFLLLLLYKAGYTHKQISNQEPPVADQQHLMLGLTKAAGSLAYLSQAPRSALNLVQTWLPLFDNHPEYVQKLMLLLSEQPPFLSKNRMGWVREKLLVAVKQDEQLKQDPGLQKIIEILLKEIMSPTANIKKTHQQLSFIINEDPSLNEIHNLKAMVAMLPSCKQQTPLDHLSLKIKLALLALNIAAPNTISNILSIILRARFTVLQKQINDLAKGQRQVIIAKPK